MLSRWQRLRMRADFQLGRATTLQWQGVRSRLQQRVDLASGLRRVATDFVFTEGPAWRGADQTLVFSDIPANCIYHLTNGTIVRLHAPSNHANGLAFDDRGRLLACEHQTRRVTRREIDGSVTVIADAYDARSLNSPNDLVVDAEGAVWFTDPPYGIRPEQQQLDFQGVFRARDGALDAVLTDFDRPNGLAFSPDGAFLYVADSSRRQHLRRFRVSRDGELTDGTVFCEMHTPYPGVPDGFAVDTDGTLYASGPGGLWIIEPNGDVVGVIALPEIASNCCFGDADLRSVYITATRSVYQLRLRDL
jgi:gluconolactonase